MPELPDVEVFRRRLARKGLRRRIVRARASDKRLLENVSAATLQKHLKNRALESTRRHGKYLFAELSGRGGWLMLHFGMTGALVVDEARHELPAHTRLYLDLADGRRIVYTDIRRFGKIGLAEHVDAYVDEHELGPDPLEDNVDLATVRECVQARGRPIKVALMDQSVLAGLGNIYCDEILFQAGIHPRAATDRLGDQEVRALHRSMHRVLKQAIEADADPEAMPEEFLLQGRHKGGECPKCGRALRTEQIGGRTTYYCARDQRRKM